MRNALSVAGITHAYRLTEHAKKRAVERLGIAREQAVNYVNQLMRSAYLQGIEGSKDGKYRIYDHHKSRTRIIINGEGDTVITVYKFKEPLNMTSIPVDFLRPTLEREKRKLRRLYTRAIRKLELEYAESLQELAEMAINRARARNPQTRELIAGRMKTKQEEISAYVSEIERQKDEWGAKIRAIEVIAE